DRLLSSTWLSAARRAIPTSAISPVSPFIRHLARAELEPESRRQAGVARLHLRAGDRAEIRSGLSSGREVIGKRRIRVARIEVVQRIKRFDPQLQSFRFSNPKLLGQREIEVEHPGPIEQG